VSGYFATERERAEYIAGMRAFLDYLETHPEVPTSRSEDIQLSTWGKTMADRMATVDEIAAMVGTEPFWCHGSPTHYYAQIKFGPIKFYAVAIRRPEDAEDEPTSELAVAVAR
jgi:hypothetical protein